jgi:hypothetical protein
VTRLCANCERKFCDGIECFLADPEPADEPTISTQTLDDLIAKYGSQLTEMHGDPLLRKDAA